MSRSRKRTKNKILKALVVINVISMILTGMALDSPSYIPMIICGVNILFLFLFTLANAPRG